MSDLSKETRDLLTRGRGGTGMPSRRRTAIKSAVLARVAVGTVVTTSATAAAWTTTTKAIGMAAVALAIGGGTVGVVKYESAKAEQEKAAVATATPNAVVTSGMPSIADPAENKANLTPLPIPVDLPPEPVVTNPAPVPVAVREGDRPTTTTTMTTANAIAKPAASSSLADETALLRQAHEALANGDPERALSLLDESARRFPTSPLEPERSAERVFAYCAEHSNDAAQKFASSFLLEHPTGPLADRVRSSCGGTN